MKNKMPVYSSKKSDLLKVTCCLPHVLLSLAPHSKGAAVRRNCRDFREDSWWSDRLPTLTVLVAILEGHPGLALHSSYSPGYLSSSLPLSRCPLRRSRYPEGSALCHAHTLLGPLNFFL